jgi:hypothetical protein
LSAYFHRLKTNLGLNTKKVQKLKQIFLRRDNLLFKFGFDRWCNQHELILQAENTHQEGKVRF